MEVDVSRILPIPPRRGDKPGDSGYSGTVADDAAILDAEACRPERQQIWSGGPVPWSRKRPSQGKGRQRNTPSEVSRS